LKNAVKKPKHTEGLVFILKEVSNMKAKSLQIFLISIKKTP
jgi:hypothetical protein